MVRDRGVRTRDRGERHSARRAHFAEELDVRTRAQHDHIAQEPGRIRARRDRITQEMRRRNEALLERLVADEVQRIIQARLGLTEEEGREILAQDDPALEEMRREILAERGAMVEEAPGRLMVNFRRPGAQPREEPSARSTVDDDVDISINNTQLTTWGQRYTIPGDGQDLLSFRFLERFAVADLHVQDLLSGPMVHHKLENFQAGSLSQGSCEITDRVVASLAKACPKLKQVRLLGACKLTDMGLAGLIEYCRRIRYIEISGSQQESGLIAAPGHLRRFKNLKHRKWCRALVKMVFYNQTNLDLESCQHLTRSHIGMGVFFGNTASDDLHRMTNGVISHVIQLQLSDAQLGCAAQQNPGEDGHQEEDIADGISRDLDGMTLDDGRDVVME